jgi:hypothetical protein
MRKWDLTFALYFHRGELRTKPNWVNHKEGSNPSLERGGTHRARTLPRGKERWYFLSPGAQALKLPGRVHREGSAILA